MVRDFLKQWREEAELMGKRLICYDVRGCMAHDWREIDSGVIVYLTKKRVYGGNPDGTPYLGIRRDDDSVFEVYLGNCQPGTFEMQAHTDFPEQNLEGLWVCLT